MLLERLSLPDIHRVIQREFSEILNTLGSYFVPSHVIRFGLDHAICVAITALSPWNV